ncbi:MAG: hypothetical protein JO267_08010 [Alphaproteobacteria bacterium]|nr:hypothetical protein [Alphaproteobacteria bacterium]
MIWAYYDESGEYDGDGRLLNMSIGGCVSRIEKWDSFKSAWEGALQRDGLQRFHMTDFEAWIPPYDFKCGDGSRDNARHNNILNSLLNMLLDHVEVFCAFSAGNQISGDSKKAHQYAIEDCTSSAISHAVHDLYGLYQQPINLVFAKQQHFSAAKMQEYVDLYDWGDGKGRIKTASVASPSDLPQLEAADILAYEMAREQRSRPRRYPFTTLLAGCKARKIPMTLKWSSTIRVVDQDAF